MKNKVETMALIEAAYLTAITVIFALLGHYIPSMSVLTMFLVSIPTIILLIKTNGKMALASVLVSYALIIILTGQIIVATIIFFTYCFSGLFIGYALKKRWEFSKTLMFASAAYLLSLLITLIFISSLEGANQIEKLILIFREYLDKSGAIFSDILTKRFPGENTSELVTDLQNILQTTYTTLQILLPSLFILSSAFTAYITLTLSKVVLNRIGYNYKYIPNFNEIKVNKSMTYGFIIFLLLVTVSKDGLIKSIFINIVYILSIILIFYGMAVVDFFMKRKRIHGLLRIVIYLVSFIILSAIGGIIPLFNPLSILLIFAFIDSNFNIRKLSDKGERHGQ